MTVCIVWTDSNFPQSQNLNTLVYNDGTVRTYKEGRIDHRCGDVQVCQSLADAAPILRRCDETKVAVPIRVARELMPSAQFAEV